MKKQTCKECKFFDAQKSTYYESGKYVNRLSGSGLCRANPPFVQTDVYGDQGLWPRVDDDDWCGKFEKR